MIPTVLALALAAQAPEAPPAQPSSQPASRPASAGPLGVARDVAAELTLIIEVGENALNVQEGWHINPSGKTIPSKELTIPSPVGAKFLAVDPSSKGFKPSETSTEVTASDSLTSQREVNTSYVLNTSGSRGEIKRRIPFSIARARVVIQNSPDLEVTTSVPNDRRVRELQGVNYAIYDMSSIAPGTELVVTLDGLPSRTLWPRRAALGVVAAILLWMAWALKTRAVPGREEGARLSPISARARRDQIVKAIEVLEKERAEEKVNPKRYERRHGELMKELALVLREIELQKASGREGAAADA